MHKKIIDRVLSGSSADDDGAVLVAAAIVRALSLLLAELKPLVGEMATHALYARSLHLARSSLPRPDFVAAEAENPLAPLQEELATRAPNAARLAGRALLTALVDLLVSMIGKPLTHRMLCTAWGVTPAELTEEKK